MKNLIKYRLQALALCMVAALAFVSSCDDDDDKGTSDVTIISFGPTGTLVGEEFTIVGTNLDLVSAVVFEPNVEVTNFSQQTKSKITFPLPDNIADGYITLRSSRGDVVSKTQFGVGRPISVASFSPATVKPGATVTLTGTYLDIVDEVWFEGVDEPVTSFPTQTRTSLSFVVPTNAKTGLITVVDVPEESWNDPIEVE